MSKGSMSERRCDGCGTMFQPSTSRHVYCSRKCNDRVSQKRRQARRPPLTPRVCPWCKSQFQPVRKNSTFCSRQCGWLQRSDQNRVSPVGRRDCIECGQTFQPANRNQRSCSKECDYRHRNPRPAPRACLGCEREFQPTRTYSVYCSNRCGHFVRGDIGSETPIAYGNCADCSRLFVRRAKSRKTYCSELCIHRANARHRRHLERTNTPEPDHIDIAVLGDRDGWTCHLCRRAVSPTARAMSPKSASIDHLLPVSAGGQHVWSNVSLAHLVCNTARGAKGVAQLRLA